MSRQDPQVGFLSLPLEVRLRVYESFLIHESQIIPVLKPDGTMGTPSVLQTCKQIYSEASLILYSGNTFLVADPGRILKWFNQIGPVNMTRLKRLRIFDDAVYCSEPKTWLGTPSESPLWYQLLDRLARKATGLRHLYIFWDSEPSCGHFGAGKDLRFVRGLAKIQGLEGMCINGYYAKQWPEYLAKKMGVRVQEADCDQCFLHSLRQYQQGTENLTL